MNFDEETLLQELAAERIEDETYSKELLNGTRGRYIISQALHYAIKAIREKPYLDIDNIVDMMVLQKTVFTEPFEDDSEIGKQTR